MNDYSLLVCIATLLVLLLSGSPVIFAIGAAGLAYFVVEPGMWSMVSVFAHKFFTGMDVFIWLSIPLFVVAGEVMGQIGMTSRLLKFSRLLVGRFRGGLAYVNILASMLFGGVSGSALADISALGPVEIDMMKRDGYRADFATALTVSSAIQGPIIPPSIPLIIFASLTNTSIGALFLAGVVPGIMVGIGLFAVVAIMVRRHGFTSRPIEGLTWRVAAVIVLEAFWALFMPVIILGGIVFGVFTATEAAAVAVAYAVLIGILVYRNLSLKTFWKVLDRSARTTAAIYLIIGFASIISWVFAAERVPSMLSDFITDIDLQVWVVLLLLNLFFLFNGLWISDSVQLLLFAPLFTPIVAELGVHPVHFGVIMVVNVMISLITPPYGLALYLGATVGGVSLGALVRQTWPFLISSIVVLLLVTLIPELSLALPRAFGFIE
ncbi:MAG: TRAP transporter large permease [Rhodospirillales bacterium]